MYNFSDVTTLNYKTKLTHKQNLKTDKLALVKHLRLKYVLIH